MDMGDNTDNNIPTTNTSTYASGVSSSSSSSSSKSSSSIDTSILKPLATIRHIALEPLHPTDNLGINFLPELQLGHAIVAGFQLVPSTSQFNSTRNPQSTQLSQAEESDLIRVGDFILGVSGTSMMGVPPSALRDAIRAARSVTPGGAVILHLSDVSIDSTLLQETSIHMAAAAAQLLGSKAAVETVQNAINAVVYSTTAASLSNPGMNPNVVAHK